MIKYVFHVEATDHDGYTQELDQDFMARSEEEARRGVIQYCNEILNIYPRKLKLTEQAEHQRSPFDFS